MNCPIRNLLECAQRNAGASHLCSQIDCCKCAAESGKASLILPEGPKGLTVYDAIIQLSQFDLTAMLIVEAPREGVRMDLVSRIATSKKGNPVIEPISVDIQF